MSTYHLKVHSLTGNTDHDVTGLASGQILYVQNPTAGVQSTGISTDGSGGLTANTMSAVTFSAGTINSGSTNLYNIFATQAQFGNFIPLSGTNGNPVTGDIEISDDINLSWNAGADTLNYNSLSTNVELTTSNGFDVVTGEILSAGTNLYNIFLSSSLSGTSGNLWSSSTGSNSIIANNGTGNLASGQYAFVAGVNNTVLGNQSFIGNGYQNNITSQLSVIVGGYQNIASGNISTLVGGYQNVASGNTSALVGGYQNIAGGEHSFIGAGKINKALGSKSSIVGGQYNLAQGVNSFIANGQFNSATTASSAIVNGSRNKASGFYSFIGNGYNNYIDAGGNHTVIVGGYNNTTNDAYTFIGTGYKNSAITAHAAVVSGYKNMANATYAAVLGGKQNLASQTNSAVAGGRYNTASGTYSFIGAGGSNIASNTYSAIVGGQNNQATAAHASVVGGIFNVASGIQSFVSNGESNTASGRASAVLAGTGHTASGRNTVVIGGGSITGSADDTVYMPNARLAETSGSIIYSAGTPLQNIFSVAGSGVQAVGQGSNITTGGTVNYPVVSTVASPSFNGLSVSGTANFTGALQSGSTDLANIFVQGSGTNGTLPLWTGTKLLGNSLLTQSGTGVTVNGSVYIYGNVDVLGTATTFNTQTIQAADNNITLNMSGSYVTAYGGGITILSGNSNGTSSTWTIDAAGNWSANTGVITSALTVNNGNINVTGGGAIQSGGTDLYNIFTQAGFVVNSVQPGTNITTGGTSTSPTINLVASPSVNNFTSSGVTSLQTTSGTTIQAMQFFRMIPYTDSNPASPADNDLWMHSAATGIITWNYRIGGVTKTVELA